MQMSRAARLLPLCALAMLAACVHSPKVEMDRNKISRVDAIQIAEHELSKKYGQQILAQRPFAAELAGKIWNVTGTLNCSPDPDDICVGGVANVQISSDTGIVLKMDHGE